MRVQVWPADREGSGSYRLRFPALALAAQGADVDVTEVGPSVLWDADWSHLDSPPCEIHALGLAARPDADVVVIQRPARAHWTELIPHLQAASVRVVVDIDDDFDAIPARNVARDNYDPQINPRHNREWIRRACDLADLVTVSTLPLAGRYGHHGRVKVLPNLIPDTYLKIDGEKIPNTVGWSGSVDTHPGDLETVGNAVRDTLAGHPGWGVHVVGTGKGVPQRLRVPQVTSTGGWVPFGTYPVELARLTVGMVPLQRSRFNAAKSCLKMAELAAVGVPVIAAPTPDNQRLHGLGVGVLADSPSMWRAHLGRLLDSEDARDGLAARGREVMAAQTYQARCSEWWDAWTTALARKATAA